MNWTDWLFGWRSPVEKDAPKPARERRSKQPIHLPTDPFDFRCRQCGKEFKVRRRRPRCPECGGADVQLLAS
jgi:rubrerythrin